MLYRVAFLLLASSLLPLPCQAAAGPLRIIRVNIHQMEDGPPVGERVHFVPGETVFLSFDVENYTRRGVESTPDEAASISWIVEAADPKGIPIDPPMPGKKAATLQPEDKNWMPRVRQAIAIPSPAPGGTYSIHVKVTDEISKESATAETRFLVAGPELQPNAALTIRSFGFYRGEDAPQPLTIPAYRAGDSMFARFQIDGFKYGKGNAIEVSYGISVLGPAGNVMYKQDPAVEDKSASFYPKPYIDANMSLSLNADTKSGEYTLVINARDNVGNQTAEIRKTFRIE